MYARVSSYQYQPDKIEELQKFREATIRAVVQQHGFISFTRLEDHANNKVMLIALFETEEDARAGFSSGFVAQQAAKAASYLVQPPTSEVYEVVAQG